MDSHELFVKEKFIQVSKFIPENSKVLDIGCGDGKLRNFLKNPYYHGIDIDKKLILELVKKGIKARQSDLNKDELPFKNQKFDFVLLLDILENLLTFCKSILQQEIDPHPNRYYEYLARF